MTSFASVPNEAVCLRASDGSPRDTRETLGQYRLASPAEKRLEERKLAAVMRIDCLCGAWFEGTAADVIDAARCHRDSEHPEWRDRGQRARRDAARAAPVSYWTGRTGSEM